MDRRDVYVYNKCMHVRCMAEALGYVHAGNGGARITRDGEGVGVTFFGDHFQLCSLINFFDIQIKLN